jgi:hypothetical protein
MQPPDQPPPRRRKGVTFRYGAWVDTAGTRMEVIRDGDVWRLHAYRSSTGRPEQIANYVDQAELFRAIANLEAHGYRYDPVWTAHDNRVRSQEDGRTRSVRIVLGTAAVCILLLAIEIIILKL